MYEEKHKETKYWFVGWLIIIFLVICCIIQSGCQTIKGVAKDIAWTADKIDKSIEVKD